MLFEFPKFGSIPEAKVSFNAIIDGLLSMQYSGRNEGRNNSAKRRHRMAMNTYAEEFVARCNTFARNEEDETIRAEWHDLRNQMINEVSALQSTKEKIQDMMANVW